MTVIITRILTILTAGFSLFACTSRQDVHIFNLGYPDAEIETISGALSDAGFNPRRNPLDIPEQIRRSSIIYPPIVEDFGEIDTIRTILASAGFPAIHLIHETEGEHYYSTENVGLYLINPDYAAPVAAATEAAADFGPELSHIYYSNCESLEAELNLFGQGAAILEVFEWNERTGAERSIRFDGVWSNTESSLRFELFDEGLIEFEFAEFDGRDNYGRYYGIDLRNTANSTELAPCDFRYITYDAKQVLNRI